MAYPTTEINIPHASYCEFIVLGDLHYGAGKQTRKLIRKCLKYAKAKNDAGIPCYVMSIGDNLDHGFKFSEGGDMDINDAFAELSDDFRQPAIDGYFIGFIRGNHDTRISKLTKSSCDLVEQLVNEWRDAYNLKTLFYSTAHLLTFKLKDGKRSTSVFIFAHHGFGGGRTVGTVFNNLERLTGLCANPDVIVAGHRHIEGTMSIARNFIDRPSGSVKKRKIQLVATGANLDDEEYALRFGLPPTCPSNTLIRITAAPDSNHQRGAVIKVEGLDDNVLC